LKNSHTSPLPQYSLAATESSLRKTKEVLAKTTVDGAILVDSRLFLLVIFDSSMPRPKLAGRKLKETKHDFVLFSFHGLPERQIRKTEFKRQGIVSVRKLVAPDHRSQPRLLSRAMLRYGSHVDSSPETG